MTAKGRHWLYRIETRCAEAYGREVFSAGLMTQSGNTVSFVEDHRIRSVYGWIAAWKTVNALRLGLWMPKGGFQR